MADLTETQAGVNRTAGTKAKKAIGRGKEIFIIIKVAIIIWKGKEKPKKSSIREIEARVRKH
ncbi:hypothetical protein [Hymenobacter terrenus]|uniref:hypothetical protein n=1 Tax=Hymenobacter terrenus TaxID=1629124 RepID=UPI000619FDFB|nr:hypothetical protein [Hymenobacter terrenus]